MGLKELPWRLGSHPNQQRQWQSSVSNEAFSSGWGGRAADLLHASYNSAGASKVSMSISLSGINSFQIGTRGDLNQYIVNSAGVLPIGGFRNNSGSYGLAINADNTYRDSDSGRRLQAFERLMSMTRENLHEEAHSKVVRSARASEATVSEALTAAAATGVDFDNNFGADTGRLGSQLQMVSRLIAGPAALGNRRQIYFCQLSGFDTHRSLITLHSKLPSELSSAMGAFATTLKQLNAWDQVTTFSASDFNRTFTPNNLDANNAGSDHAWGGHAMVMGGSVKGGDLYGHFPNLRTGEVDGSIDRSRNGNWIPDTSVDQYSAVLANWMGASSSDLEAIFPNLGRFDNPLTNESANLGFL